MANEIARAAYLTRRQFFAKSSIGLGGVALASLLAGAAGAIVPDRFSVHDSSTALPPRSPYAPPPSSMGLNASLPVGFGVMFCTILW